MNYQPENQPAHSNASSSNSSADLSQRAVLVQMVISRYRAKGRHKEVDQNITNFLGTKRKAGSMQINLLDPEAIKETQNSAYNLSKWYKAMTLPWDENYRILPSALYDRFTEGYKIRLEADYKATDAFISIYPQLLREARLDLGEELYGIMEFPPITQIRSKFGVHLSYLPVPVAGDFRITLSENEMEKLRNELDERNKAMLARSMHDAWVRLHDVVVDMVDRLNKPKFRDTIIGNIRNLTDILPELNLAGDEDLNKVRDEIVEKLCRYTPEQLRDNEGRREEVAEAAGKILSGMRRLRIDLNEVSTDNQGE